MSDEAKLSPGKKSAWALGSIADVYMSNALNYLAFPIYNLGLGVDPRFLGWALGLPRIWEALTDPLMGNISDNTHTRWGRRRPYIFIGAILCMVTFGLIWSPPTGWSPKAIGWYFMGMTFLFYTVYTVFTIPWGALGLELTSDYNERTRVQAYRTVFQAVGGLGLGTMWVLAQKWGGGNDVAGVRIVGWVFGALILVCGILPALCCREKLHVQSQEKLPFWASVRTTFSNRVFLLLIAALALAAPGLSCMWTISSSMLADICDLDEKKTGRRREGMFGASYAWACKVGISLTMILSGYMLTWSGFDAKVTVQPAQVITNMRLLYMLVPMGFVGLAALLLAFYPLSEKKIRELQAELLTQDKS